VAQFVPPGVAGTPEAILEYLVRNARTVETSPAVTVIDVGANVGQTAALLVKAGADRVVSFEPNPRTCAKFLDNAVRYVNGTRPELVCAALGFRFGTAQFVDTPQSTSFMQQKMGSDKSGALMTIPVVPLASTLTALGVNAVSVLKIDTQGREEGVLMGFGAEFLSTTPHIVLEFSYSLLQIAGTDHVKLIHWLADAGFACKYMDKHAINGKDSWPLSMAGASDVSASPDWNGAGCVSFEAFVSAVKGGWTNLWCKNTQL
jgi:FkbM family methyltransferase